MTAAIPFRRICSCALSGLAFCSASAMAGWSDPDPSFGADGLARVDIGSHSADTAFVAAADAHGNLYVAGSSTAAATGGGYGVALAKFTHDGLVDTTFGDNGRIALDLAPGLNDRATAIGIGADGMLYVAGVEPTSAAGFPSDFFLMKFDLDGRPAPGFGSGGVVAIDATGTGTNDFVCSLAFDSHGKIYVAGEVRRPPHSDFAVLKFDAQGQLDTTFGDNGRRVIDFGGDDTPYSVAMTADDRLVIAGGTSAGSDYEFAAAMIDADGQLVDGFGEGGLARFGVSDSHASALAVALDRVGAVYLAGYTRSPQFNFAVVKLSAEGVLDTSFGDGGYREVDTGSGETDLLKSILVDADDHVLLSGYRSNGAGADFAVAALDRDGNVLDAFNPGGVRTYDFGSVAESANAMVLDPVTKGVVLAGYFSSDNASDFDFAAFRLPRGPAPDRLFANGFDLAAGAQRE